MLVIFLKSSHSELFKKITNICETQPSISNLPNGRLPDSLHLFLSVLNTLKNNLFNRFKDWSAAAGKAPAFQLDRVNNPDARYQSLCTSRESRNCKDIAFTNRLRTRGGIASKPLSSALSPV
jgi:hypothetical protein